MISSYKTFSGYLFRSCHKGLMFFMYAPPSSHFWSKRSHFIFSGMFLNSHNFQGGKLSLQPYMARDTIYEGRMKFRILFNHSEKIQGDFVHWHKA